MEPINVASYLLCFSFVISISILIRSFLHRHMFGTLKVDNSGEASCRYRFEFDNLGDLEDVGFVIVKVKKEDLSLPGERKSQY